MGFYYPRIEGLGGDGGARGENPRWVWIMFFGGGEGVDGMGKGRGVGIEWMEMVRDG